MDLKGLDIRDMDRRTVSRLLLAGVLVLAVLWGFFHAHKSFSALERRLEAKRADMESFALIARDYVKKRASVESALKRAYVQSRGGGVVAAVEEMVKKIGAGGKVVAVKPLGEDKTRGYTERIYLVTIEGVDLNQVVNLVYLITRHRTLLVIREFSMVSRFDDPDLLDVKIKLTHVTKIKVS